MRTTTGNDRDNLLLHMQQKVVTGILCNVRVDEGRWISDERSNRAGTASSPCCVTDRSFDGAEPSAPQVVRLLELTLSGIPVHSARLESKQELVRTIQLCQR